MKIAIIIGIVAFLFAGVAFAKVSYLIVHKQWAQVDTGYQKTDIYKVFDAEHKVACYYAYMSGQRNVQPTQSCVKVK